MKTVKEWLKERLSKEDYEKAEKYESENWDWKAESFEDALLDAFTWDKTDEGWNYWDKIFSNGGSIEISNDEKLESAPSTPPPNYLTTKTETMKDLTKVFIDLSKLNEEQIKALPQIFENSGDKVLPETLSDLISGKITDGFKFLFYSPSGWNQNDYPLNGRTELTYPEFIKLFEGGEEKTINMTFGITDKNMEIINKQISRFEGAEFDRLSWEKIAKEIGWDLPTIILWYFEKKESQNKWIDAQKEQPLCISTGNWDGKQSDIVLAETFTGKKFLAQCYEGFMDGSAFYDWCQVDEINSNDWLITESVKRWMKIPF